jgi:hypothetical protein
MLLPALTDAQNLRKKDFSVWTWVQVQKKISKKQYIELQYQVRFDQNASQFNRSNIYFIYGNNFRKHFNLELLYQLNENYRKDQHTFYAGLTYRQSILPHLSVAVRTAVQSTRNYFTGDVYADKLYTEWRSRMRLTYNIYKPFDLSVSAEPYLLFKSARAPYLSRVRYVTQLSYKYNRIQKFTLFYLIQPDVISHHVPKINHVLGMAYHFTLPEEPGSFKKHFDTKAHS